jgi:quercetin dioxygenase-like cupin family protein
MGSNAKERMMRVVKTTEVAPKPMEAYGTEGVTLREVFTAETGAPTFALRHFEVAVGCAAHSHFHPWEHEVYILEGEGEIVGEAGAVPFRAGDSCYTAPNELHQFRNTGTTPLRFLCVIPNQPSVAPTDAPVREGEPVAVTSRM